MTGSDIYGMWYGQYSYGHWGGVWTDNAMHGKPTNVRLRTLEEERVPVFFLLLFSGEGREKCIEYDGYGVCMCVCDGK